MTTLPHKPRGLAALSPERRAEIARMGGIAVQRTGVGHAFTSAEAKAAGRLSRSKKPKPSPEQP